ncbi:MAG: CvpA family protein [Prevotellaceae bacterium]|jgi:membrane protein required for colicin V production|nr:CvpA family protein [Prevotellaceae bacterium]
MNIYDYILLAPITFGLAFGFYRGLFKELVALFCVILGICAVRYFGAICADFLVKTLSISSSPAMAISSIVIFIVAVILLNILANMLTKIFKAMKINWLNRLAGMFFGGFKWVLILSIILNIITLFYQKIPAKNGNPLAKSMFYKPIEKTISKVVPFAKFR